MSKEGKKDGRGRKEHELKRLCRERQDVREALCNLADNLRKMQDLVCHLISDGINIQGEIIKIEKISIPTLSGILDEHGHVRAKGRPKGTGSTSWTNNPHAIQAVANILREHGLHKGREKLLTEGIDYLNDHGKSEHYSFVGENGKKLLSITTLREIAKDNGVTFSVGPKKSSESSMPSNSLEDDDEDEDDEIDEDDDEIDDEDEDDDLEDEDDDLDEEDELEDEDLDDELEEDFDDELDDFQEEEDSEEED